MKEEILLTKEQVKAKFKISEDCTFHPSGGKCCHALNPVKKYGCNVFCGKDAAVWIKTNYPEYTAERTISILARILSDELMHVRRTNEQNRFD